MVSEEVSSRIEEIEQEKPNWENKQVVIQAIGEIIEEKDSFIDSFLLCEDFEKHYGVLWVSEEIDYIPSLVLEILGGNGMRIEQKNYNNTNQIIFY